MEEEKVLPVIDLSLAKGHTRAGLVKELHEALTTVGFIYLKNVDGYDEEALLRHSKWFFSLPMEQRMAISKKSFNPKCSNEYRGYFPVIPGAVSHKEAFEIGPKQGKPKEGLISLEEKFIIEDNQWPLESRGIRGGQELQDMDGGLPREDDRGFAGAAEPDRGRLRSTQRLLRRHLQGSASLHAPAHPLPGQTQPDI
ncbi:uncharacterized protein LOC126989063 [Eriocheir sinensis]|uniref:uncharacterized protein LOC126989063 n=1 Tax=Eriocheir sinensis TaxID=95602 RepID=UPI0021CA96DE|nr:uncharacterized protein LOC126989063 [Eriocheir sinensis]